MRGSGKRPPLGHDTIFFGPSGTDWAIRCECGWYSRSEPIEPTEPPPGLSFDYEAHLEDVLRPREEDSIVEARRRPRGPLEIRCPACRGYGHIPPTDLDVPRKRCDTCAGSGTVLAAVVPHSVAIRLPDDVEYLEIDMGGSVIMRRKL